MELRHAIREVVCGAYPRPLLRGKRESGKMFQVIPTGIESHEHYDGIFSIYKLNGTAGTRDNREMLVKSYDPVVYGQTGRLDSGNLRLTLHFYQNVTRGKDEPYLQFSWEDDNRRASVLGLIESFAPVETLVVIGYSFPLFNRDLDRTVFEVLRPSEVFLQVAGDEAVIDRLVVWGWNRESSRSFATRTSFTSRTRTHPPRGYRGRVAMNRIVTHADTPSTCSRGLHGSSGPRHEACSATVRWWPDAGLDAIVRR